MICVLCAGEWVGVVCVGGCMCVHTYVHAELASVHLCNTLALSLQDCCVYFIASGSVSVYRENAEGESVSAPDEARAYSPCCMRHAP